MATSLQQTAMNPTAEKFVRYTSDNWKYAIQNSHTAWAIVTYLSMRVSH